MNGQTLYYNEKQDIVDKFVGKANIYEAITPFKFDLRGYKKYLIENKIQNEDITQDMVEKFMN